MLKMLCEANGGEVVLKSMAVSERLDFPRDEPRSFCSTLPKDLLFFKNAVDSLMLFGSKGGPPNRNGWIFVNKDLVYGNVNEMLLHGMTEGADPYLNSVYVIGENAVTGFLGVDLNPGRFGWIGFYWFDYDLSEAGFPVVAHSFSEWLEKTIKSGPDVRYWERDDFTGLGTAIPR